MCNLRGYLLSQVDTSFSFFIFNNCFFIANFVKSKKKNDNKKESLLFCKDSVPILLQKCCSVCYSVSCYTVYVVRVRGDDDLRYEACVHHEGDDGLRYEACAHHREGDDLRDEVCVHHREGGGDEVDDRDDADRHSLCGHGSCYKSSSHRLNTCFCCAHD